MNILITAGGTREYIDGVRYIGNCSSGRTGAQLAEHLSSKGHHVTWLGAKDAVRPKISKEQLAFETYGDLHKALKRSLSKWHYDVVFHAAAVSDFKVTGVMFNDVLVTADRNCKISTVNDMKICLERNPKLIDHIKTWSINPNLLLVGFKLTNTQCSKHIKSAVDKLFSHGVVDYVAQNNLPEITNDQHPLNLYHRNGKVIPCSSPEAMCDQVLQQQEQAA